MLQAPSTNLVMGTKPCVDRQVSTGKMGARAVHPGGDVRAWQLQGFYAVPATSYPYIIPEGSSWTHTGSMDAEDINAFPKSTGRVTHPQFLPQINLGTPLRWSS